MFFDELIVVFCYLVHNLGEEVLGNDLSYLTQTEVTPLSQCEVIVGISL